MVTIADSKMVGEIYKRRVKRRYHLNQEDTMSEIFLKKKNIVFRIDVHLNETFGPRNEFYFKLVALRKLE